MSRISPKSVADRFLHTLNGCHPDIDGNIGLEPTNFYNNWTFAEVNDENDPIGLEVGLPEDPDGFWIYCGKKAEGAKTMSAQNTEIVDLDDNLFTIDEKPVDGHAPVTSTMATQLIGRPPSPTIRKKDRAKVGFKAGTYKVAYTWVKNGKHTELSPMIDVVLANGQFLRVALPTSPPEGVTGIGIWVSRTDFAGLRLQKIVNVRHQRPEFVTIRQFTNKGKGSGNETGRRKPRRPSLRKRRGRRKGKEGTFLASQKEVDDETGRETESSDISNEVVVTSDEASRNVHLSVEDTNQGRNPRENTSHRVYINRDGKDYVYNDRTEGSAARPLSSRRSATPSTSGRLQDESATGERGVLSDSTYSTPYSQDQKDVIDPPDSPLDDTLTVGVGPDYIDAGTYWVSIAYAIRGEETMTTDPQKITITSSEVIQVLLPDPVDYFVNSQWLDLDRDGKPDGWDFTGIAGTTSEGAASVTEDGDLFLTTLGAKNTGTGAITPVVSQTIDINRNSFHTVGGTLNATLLNTTTAVVVEMIELDDAGAAISGGTHTLKTVTGNGTVEFQGTFGKDTPIEYLSNTASVKFQVRFGANPALAGNIRDGTISISELYFHPHKGRVRRRHAPHKGDAEHSNATPDTNKRNDKRHTKGVELPPVKSRKPPSVVPLAVATWEDGNLVPAGWTHREVSRVAPGLVSENITGAVIDATATNLRGWHIDKNDATNRYSYFHRSFGSSNPALGVHLKVRINVRPTTGEVYLAQIKHAQGDNATDALAYVSINSGGNIYLRYRNYVGNESQVTLASNVPVTSVLDIELLCRNAGTNSGVLTVGLGINTQRTFRAPIKVAWASSAGLSQKHANVAQVGPSGYTSPKVQYDFHIDSVAVTEFGDQLANPGVPPPLEPIPIPDRPYQTPVTLEDVTFEGGVLPTVAWSVTGAVTVISGSLIDGTYVMRSQDSSAAAFNEQYIAKTLSATDTVGLRSKIKLTQRPTSGSVALLKVLSTSLTEMATVYIDSTGALFARPTDGSGTPMTATKIATGLTDGTTITLEIVVGGAGTTGGFMETWLEVGSTGGLMARSLMSQDTAIDWSASQVGRLRVGGQTMGTAPAITSLYTFDYDGIKITQRGEVQLIEVADDGTPIYQINVWFHPEQPVRDDLYVKGLRLAVRPGEQYTCAIQAKHVGVIGTAYPYFFSAHDATGNEYALGSLYGSGGASGTQGWVDLTQTFTIPAGCYELRMNSRQMGQGEFTCQALAITRGLSPIREVTYPSTGQFKLSLDTRVPNAAIAWRVRNTWLRLDALVNDEENASGDSTSHSIRYGSSNTDFVPEYWTTDPDIVEQRNWAHFEVTLNADPTLRLSPIVLSDEPGVEVKAVNGNTQVSCLLRSDLSELPGGVYLDEVHFPRETSEWDQWKPRGHFRRHRRYAPVGSMKGFAINAFTEDAMREIEEQSMNTEFVVESRNRRYSIKFPDPIEFDGKTHTARQDENDMWHMWGIAKTENVEITEIGEVPDKVNP